MRGRAGLRWDIALYAGSALLAGLTALYEHIPLLRDWGAMAVAPYAAGALIAAVVAAGRATTDASLRRRRVATMALVLVTAAVLPTSVGIALRDRDGARFHAQSETILPEEAAGALVDGRNPYSESYDDGPLAGWPAGVRRHLPYTPGILVFGLPRALAGPAPVTDSRVGFALVALLAAGAALAVSRPGADRSIPVILVLIALPTGARSLIGGGNDVAVLGVMLLSLVLLRGGRPVAAGVAAGVAAAIKQTAWPLLPFLVVAARDRRGDPARGRAAAAILAVLLPAIVPFVAWDPGVFVEDVVRFPLGLADEPTIAAGPTLGRLLVDSVPAARWAVVALAGTAIALAGAFMLVRRPPSDAAGAAERAAALIAMAVLLAPAGRLGYLIYPINLLVWSRVLMGTGTPAPYGGAKTVASVSRRRRRRNSNPSEAAAANPTSTTASPGATRSTS